MKLLSPLAAFALLLVPGATGCSNKAPEERKEAVTRPADEPRPADPTRAAPPTAAPPPTASAPAGGVPNDFPKDCADYAALIDKLKTCDQLGGARASLIGAYETLRSAWASAPADRRDEVARQCNTQAESLRNAAAATCAW